MPGPSAAERRLHAQTAIHTRWSRTADRSAATAPARDAFDKRFEPDDPDGRLTPAQRAAMADSARRAYFAGLAAKAAVARRRAKEARAAEAEARRAERAARLGHEVPAPRHEGAA